MNKRQQLIDLLNAILQSSPLLERLSPSASFIADRLLNLDDPDKWEVIETIKNSFGGGSRSLIESVDFGGSDYWIRQIVDILKGK